MRAHWKTIATVLTTAAAVAASALAVPWLSTRDDQPAGRPTGIAEIREQYLDPRGPVMVVAHRGYWRGAPENSLAAVELAIRKGAEVVEIDVQRTADGELVLMHDTTVDRTTDGRGAVSSLTLAQVRALKLRTGLGGAQAPVTEHQVPTLAEALRVVKGRALINLDKGWAFRDQEYDLLTATGTLDHAIFKSSAPVAEVEQFLARDPRILYSHVVDDANASSLGAFARRLPSYELVFDRLTDAQIQPAAVAAVAKASRIWINTMWYGLAAGSTDEKSLIDPKLGWAAVVDRHQGDMIQTDDQEQLISWLHSGDRNHDRKTWPELPRDTVRVQAEDYSTDGKGVGYSDQDDENRGGAIARPYEGVDVCDQAGAVAVCWIRGGEWIKYAVDVPRTGTYAIAARVSSPYHPAGRITVALDNKESAPADLVTTTSHNAFTLQPVTTQRLTKGRHELVVRVDATAYQNFNLDYLQLTRKG
ncbi:glycerophosphodiester phosphodiesterase family protein [Kribbella italica]|uniref:Glycerophosphoryl diester phosphodiesterase n=1 Tax=Kribbella italica TaxID=1540520 RepID=A0A7W9MY52_9ACTN|nr:glycerophosphodiester phosphodiesterase family protein [Kribbella italica]MBB5840060.1 glycerophosphoryl diester phosphodiesterase [Kribbella italica]